MAAYVRPGDAVEACVLQVDDIAAIQAHEVMVLVQFWVEARRRTGVAGLGQETEGDKFSQDPIDGHP